MKTLLLILVSAALLACGLAGTGTRLLFVWPVYLLLGLAGVLSLVMWRERARCIPARYCLLAGGAFAFYLFWRCLNSPVEYLARQDLFLVLACGLVYGFTATQFTRSRDRLVLFWLLVALAMVNLVVGMVHFSGNPEFSIIPGFKRTYPAGRIGGVFNNPNHLGAFLAFMSLLTLAQAVFGRGGPALRMVLLFLTTLMVLGMGLTVSRGALVGFVGGFLVFVVQCFYVVRHLHRELFFRAGLLMGGALSGIVVTVVIVNLTFFDHREGEVEAGFFGESARSHFWHAAVDQFVSRPLVGTGGRTYEYLSRLYRPPELLHAEGEIEFAHNEYLQLLADYGIAGTVFFLIAAVMHFGNGFLFLRWFCVEEFSRSGRRSSTNLALVTGSAAGLAALLTHAVFDFHFHIPAVALPAAFAFGLMANPGMTSPARRGARAPLLEAALKVVMIVTGSAMVFFGFNYGRSELYLEKGKRLRSKELSFDSVSFFARAQELDPRNPGVFTSSGEAWMDRVGNGMPEAVSKSFLAKAKEEYEKAYALYPSDIYTIVELGKCLDGMGIHERAEEKFLEALEWAPLFQHTRLAYAVHLHLLKRYDEAAEAYKSCHEGHSLQRDIYGSLERVQKLEKLLEEDRAREVDSAAAPASEAP